MTNRLAALVLLVSCGCSSWVRTAADLAPSEPAAPHQNYGSTVPDGPGAVRKALLENRLSVDFQGVPLYEVLELLSLHARFGLVVDGHVSDERLKQPVVLKLQDASVYAVFHWLFRGEDLTWAVDRDQILVAPYKYIQPEAWNPHVDFVDATEETWRAKTSQALGTQRLSVDLDDVPCESALRVVAERARLNLVLAPGIERSLRRRIVLKKGDAPVSEILDALTAGAGLAWSLEGEAVYVFPRGT
jgi:type II secretory pathway component HofQ